MVVYIILNTCLQEYPDYMKASIDSEAHIVDPSVPAFSGMELEEEKFYRLVKKNVEETEATKIQGVDLISSGRDECQPPVHVQLVYGEASDDINVSRISDISSNGISATSTSSEYIRSGPSECFSTDCTGRTCDSGLGWASSSLGLTDVLVSPPSAVSGDNVVQIESECKTEPGVPKLALSESFAMQPTEICSSTHRLTSANPTGKIPGFETLVDALLDDDGGDYANKRF